MGKTEGAVTIKVKAGGKEFGDLVIAFSLTCAVNTVSYAELVLADGDVTAPNFELSGNPDFAPGKEIEFELGHSPETEPIFKGVVVRHQIKAHHRGGSSLFLEIKDAAVKMTQVRKTRHFLDQTDKDIIEKLIQDHGLTPDVKGEFKANHERMIQYEVTDWDFMRMRAEANAKLIWIDEGKVTVNSPDVQEASDTPKASYGNNVYEFEVECESRDQYKEGNAIAWDPAGQELFTQEADAPGNVEEGKFPTSEAMAKSLGDGIFQLRHSGELTEAELKAWSDGKLMRSRLSRIRGRVRLDGDKALKPGGTLILEGFSKVFNGVVLISAVRHQILDGRWLTDVEIGLAPEILAEQSVNAIEPPAAGLLGPMRGLQIGMVKEIEEDPLGAFRVQVKMPVIDDDEDGIWCRVARPDAGASHSVFFQPAVGDEVVIGFLNEDPRHAIVLGSLHNGDANKSPIDDNDKYAKKGIVTAAGLMLTFNDKDKIILIETPSGKKVTIDEDADVIQIEDDHNNKIAMDKDGITIESGKDIVLKAKGDVTIEGMNIEQTAQAQFKAEGTAGIEVSSSANAVLKGAIVQIN